MSMRMMSKDSPNMVYHRPECRYARKIRKQNRIQMTWQDAEWRGYRPCKCCDNAKYLYNRELGNIEYFGKKHGIDVDFENNAVYVRTDVGCWKIVYKKSRQKFVLFHRNYVKGRIGLDEVERVPYHKQGDVPVSGSIMKYLNYIQKHDDFKQNESVDYRQMPRKTHRQECYYQAAKKKAEKRSAKRLDNLFLLIERKEGIRQLSFC